MKLSARRRYIAYASLACMAVFFIGACAYAVWRWRSYEQELIADLSNPTEELAESPVPLPVPVDPVDIVREPHDTSALGGYNVLIADRGNNRVIEVTPDKRIVWEYDFNLPHAGLGADDAFFIDGGKGIIVNLEEYQVLQEIDYATKQVVWSYGVPGKAGSRAGYLHTPDDAYSLPNGDVTVADIQNCRIIEIAPDKHIVRQYGTTRVCKNGDGFLNKPNGDTPLPNGHMLVSTIGDKKALELDQDWKPVFSMSLPVRYPSDPQMMQDGSILISDYSNPGKIVAVGRDGAVRFEQYYAKGPLKMNKPSLAIELPNGHILANDDYNHRVIVIDKQSHQILWQYGVTGKPGRADGQLNVPDGLDIIMRGSSQQSAPAARTETPYSVGYVMRHAEEFLNTNIVVQGYVLRKENSYALVSDERGGAVSSHDLPVAGDGTEDFAYGKMYAFAGTLVRSGLSARNRNPYHLVFIKR